MIIENKPAKGIALVKTIISLHEQGYSEDFFINEKKELIWGQNGYSVMDLTLDMSELKLGAKKHLNTVLFRITLHSGIKGILLCQRSHIDISDAKNRFPDAR